MLATMMHANDNDTIQRQQAMNELFDARGPALLNGLYARKLLVAQHKVGAACAAKGTSFQVIDTMYFVQDEDEQRAFLLQEFGSDELADAFEAVWEYHSHAEYFFHALAAEYIKGRSSATEREIEDCRGALVTLLWELGGVGNHEAEELVRRHEQNIRQAIAGVSINYSGLVSR